MLGWCFVHLMGQALHSADWEQQSRSWIDEWLLGKILAGVLMDLGLDEAAAWQAVAAVKSLTTHQRWLEQEWNRPAGKRGKKQLAAERARRVLTTLLQDDEIQQFLLVNRYQGVLWFNKEAFERVIWWMLFLAAVEISAARPEAEVALAMVEQYDVVGKLLKAEKESGYQVERLIELV
jgi:hypothetical protein